MSKNNSEITNLDEYFNCFDIMEKKSIFANLSLFNFFKKSRIKIVIC